MYHLRDQVQVLVSAGTDTVAHTLRVLTFHICNNPDILERIREEVRQLELEDFTSLRLRDLEQLPYLTSVIYEGLRLSEGATLRLTRIAPDRDLRYRDWVIPAGSPVGMTMHSILQNKEIFPNPSKFDPQRWMDPTDRRRLEKYAVMFSRGTRNCLGLK